MGNVSPKLPAAVMSAVHPDRLGHMAQCANCKKCNNPPMRNFGRNTGRTLLATNTFGLSEVALKMTKTCKVCGHKQSLHEDKPASREDEIGEWAQEEIERLASMHSRGLITEDEFTAAKNQVLGI